MQGLMPEDSGWYWWVADGYQSGLFVQVIRNTAVTVSNPLVTATITPVTATTPSPAAMMTSTPQAIVSTPGYPMVVPLAQGNTDHLSIYQTYGSKWSDHQGIQINQRLANLSLEESMCQCS